MSDPDAIDAIVVLAALVDSTAHPEAVTALAVVRARVAELARLRGIVATIGAALVDPEDRECLFGALFSEFGMERAREVMAVLDAVPTNAPRARASELPADQ